MKKMYQRTRAYLNSAKWEGGRVTVATVFLGVGIIMIGLITELPGGHSIQKAQAATTTTSVTVLNTPPDWTIDAQEDPGSSSSTPTDSGQNVTWRATATDSSGDAYYLIICKTTASSTGNGGAPPSCAGGLANRWAVSSLTTSGTSATAATTTAESFVESNVWTAWICDSNASNPQCNPAYTSGSGTTSSPFVVNHRPTFTAFADNSPANPGVLVSWTTTATDTDIVGGGDTVSLFVCKAADFTGTACGAAGTWCSAIASSTDPSCNFTLENPKPDGTYLSVGYIIDNHNHAASGGQQAADSVLVVNNVTPSVGAGSISLLDTDGVGNLTLLTPAASTTGFQVRYTVTDQNSCTTTTNGQEISSAIFSVYRSGVTAASCDASGEYNANNCYPSDVGTGIFSYSCTQDTGTCSGNNDSTADWTCTFPLWYVAESTDGAGGPTDSPYFAQNWLATVAAADNNFATSTPTEGSSGNELISFLAYDVTTSTIPYGGLQPGQQTDPIPVQTVMRAVGNVGLDETLYGTDMCPTYPTCTGNATSTIFIANQRYGTSSLAYGSATVLLANPGAELEVNIQKSTTTGSPAQKTTYWGIAVPGAITLAGDYFGRNTLIGITGESANW